MAVLVLKGGCRCGDNTDGEYSGLEHEAVEGVMESAKVSSVSLAQGAKAGVSGGEENSCDGLEHERVQGVVIS